MYTWSFVFDLRMLNRVRHVNCQPNAQSNTAVIHHAPPCCAGTVHVGCRGPWVRHVPRQPLAVLPGSTRAQSPRTQQLPRRFLYHQGTLQHRCDTRLGQFAACMHCGPCGKIMCATFRPRLEQTGSTTSSGQGTSCSVCGCMCVRLRVCVWL